MWTPECLDHCITVQECEYHFLYVCISVYLSVCTDCLSILTYSTFLSPRVAVTAYMDLSRSAAVPGCGSNQEYALHQLYYNKGDIRRAILALMSKNVSPQFLQFIQGYHYQNSDLWSPEDIQIFRDVIARVDKDFISITKEVSRLLSVGCVVMLAVSLTVCSILSLSPSLQFKGRKTHKQCVEFYYFWKKVCIDEYKRLGRKRKYNLRSRRGTYCLVSLTHSLISLSYPLISHSYPLISHFILTDLFSSQREEETTTVPLLKSRPLTTTKTRLASTMSREERLRRRAAPRPVPFPRT